MTMGIDCYSDEILVTKDGIIKFAKQWSLLYKEEKSILESGGFIGCKDEYALNCGFSAPNPQFNKRLDFLVNNNLVEKINFTEENFNKWKKFVNYSKEQRKCKNIYIVHEDWRNILLDCDLSSRGSKRSSKCVDDRERWKEKRRENRNKKDNGSIK